MQGDKAQSLWLLLPFLNLGETPSSCQWAFVMQLEMQRMGPRGKLSRQWETEAEERAGLMNPDFPPLRDCSEACPSGGSLGAEQPHWPNICYAFPRSPEQHCNIPPCQSHPLLPQSSFPSLLHRRLSTDVNFHFPWGLIFQAWKPALPLLMRGSLNLLRAC